MNGVFATWQPRYAAHGIPTFPVRIGSDKKPAVRGYMRVGISGSQQLAIKFPAENALGFVLGKRTSITVLDIDTSCERTRDEAFDRHGEPAIVVRTASGRWHGWYRFSGEPRRIRPWPERPIDLLGFGYVVAPPSKTPQGRYEFIKGGLEDVPRLAPIGGLGKGCDSASLTVVLQGTRDNWLFRRLLREVRACDDFETLLDVARSLNMNCMPPLSDVQVVSKVKQAWKYEIEGRNWAGRHARASTDRDEILELSNYPPAAMLLYLLRVSHPDPDAEFAIDQVQTAKLLGWSRPTLRSSIQALIASKRLARIRFGGPGDPHLYKLTHVKKTDTI